MSDLKFSCPHCAQHIICDPAWAGHSIQCPSCHQQITVAPPQAGLRVSSAGTGPPPIAGGSASGEIPARMATAPPSQPWSGLAIASLVLCTGVGFGFLGWIAGIVCGHMAKTRIRMNPNLRGNGLATAGLIINYSFLFLLSAGICLAFYFKHEKEKRAVQQQKEWTARETQRKEAYQQAVAENRIPFREPKLETPTNAVSGQIAAREFHYEHAFVRTYSFTIREGKYSLPERQVTVTTWVKPQDLANKTLLVTPDMKAPRLTVRAEWLDENKKMQTKNVFAGYSLRMKCGPIENGRMSGSIDLRMPGAPLTAIKGDFIAAVQR